jgi:hypothetical protein
VAAVISDRPDPLWPQAWLLWQVNVIITVPHFLIAQIFGQSGPGGEHFKGNPNGAPITRTDLVRYRIGPWGGSLAFV